MGWGRMLELLGYTKTKNGNAIFSFKNPYWV
jgi:hypothetical protein